MWTIFTREEHVVRWAWSTYERNRGYVLALIERRPELPIVRCTSHTDAADVVAACRRVALRP